MALLILSSLVISIFTFFIYIILARRERFKLREKIGLSGPEPHWFLGNLKQTAEFVILKIKKTYHLIILISRRKEKLGYDDANRWFNELHEQYGETFGFVVTVT